MQCEHPEEGVACVLLGLKSTFRSRPLTRWMTVSWSAPSPGQILASRSQELSDRIQTSYLTCMDYQKRPRDREERLLIRVWPLLVFEMRRGKHMKSSRNGCL